MNDEMKGYHKVGRQIGTMYLGILDAGVSRDDAISVVVAIWKIMTVKLPQEQLDAVVKKLMDGGKA